MVRFGLFTFDPEAGELKKGDRVVKLHPQPAQLLALLVWRPRELAAIAVAFLSQPSAGEIPGYRGSLWLP